VTFSATAEMPTRHELERVLSTVSAINYRLKAFDREIGLSKSYISKQSGKVGQGRMSPVEGEPDARWSVRDPEPPRRRAGRLGGNKGGGSFERAGEKMQNPAYDDKMED
jgi:hypothetical protein